MVNGEHVRDYANRVAQEAARNFLSMIEINSELSRRMLQQAVSVSVLVALGCTCTPGRRMEFAHGGSPEAIYFEDLTCKVHGIGPIDDLPKQPDPRNEPGG